MPRSARVRPPPFPRFCQGTATIPRSRGSGFFPDHRSRQNPPAPEAPQSARDRAIPPARRTQRLRTAPEPRRQPAKRGFARAPLRGLEASMSRSGRRVPAMRPAPIRPASETRPRRTGFPGCARRGVAQVLPPGPACGRTRWVGPGNAPGRKVFRLFRRSRWRSVAGCRVVRRGCSRGRPGYRGSSAGPAIARWCGRGRFRGGARRRCRSGRRAVQESRITGPPRAGRPRR